MTFTWWWLTEKQRKDHQVQTSDIFDARKSSLTQLTLRFLDSNSRQYWLLTVCCLPCKNCKLENCQQSICFAFVLLHLEGITLLVKCYARKGLLMSLCFAGIRVQQCDGMRVQLCAEVRLQLITKILSLYFALNVARRLLS